MSDALDVVEESFPMSQYCVVMVDDDQNIIQALKRSFRREPYKVLFAESGAEGLKLLSETSSVAVIISDQRMPGMNGTQFLSRSKDFAPDAVKMLLSGYSDMEATIAAINEGGATQYISKPWDDSALLQTVRSGIRHYHLIKENFSQQEIIKQQYDELQMWNDNLKERVLQQTTAIRQKSDEVHAALTKSRANFNGIIEALASLVELRGKRTHQHSRNVATLSVNAAKEIGIIGEDLENIRIAALLHDIGEIGMPERLLLMSPEFMNSDEFREFSQHPIRAQLMLDSIVELRPAALLIRHHHENMDGTGYPDKLEGSAISIGARIIAFADHIDQAAMMCAGDVADQAIARVNLLVGKKLDSSLQHIFKKIVRYCYFSESKPEGPKTIEREFQPDELVPGMVLTRNLFSGTGMLLLNRGLTLDKNRIDAIRRYYGLDPAESGIFCTMPAKNRD